MLEETLAEFAQKLKHTVRLDTGYYITPEQEDFEKILDEAARQLYNEPVGATLRIARLLIERKEGYFDVYQHVGIYK
jgi:hypothetical protein